jgi:hypothetical protein
MKEIYDPIFDNKQIEQLAKNPIQMASRIMMIEKRIRSLNLFNEPSRRAGLLEQLKTLVVRSKEDPETVHGEADDLLLEYINDEEISQLFGQIEKWYG